MNDLASALGLDSKRYRIWRRNKTEKKADQGMKLLEKRHAGEEDPENNPLSLKQEQLADLKRRFVSRPADDPALDTDDCELQVLCAAIAATLDDSRSHRKDLAKARLNHGTALVERFPPDAGREDALFAHVMTLNSSDGGRHEAEAALMGIDALMASPQAQLVTLSRNLASRLAERSLSLAKEVVPQRDRSPGRLPRVPLDSAPRTPNDVLVHVSTLVDDALELHGDSAELQALARRGRSLFMTHKADMSSVGQLLDDAGVVFRNLDEPDLETSCRYLGGHLPKKKKEHPSFIDQEEQLDSTVKEEQIDDNTPEGQSGIPDTLLIDNIYGRVFDTKMVSELVKNPPQELLDVSGRSGALFAGMLDSMPYAKKAADDFAERYIWQDKRPWFAAVPAFEALAEESEQESTLDRVKQFLRNAPTTGEGIIAFSYTMTKISVLLQNGSGSPDYMKKAGENYSSAIRPQANRTENVAKKGAGGRRIITDGAGITLLHQPDASGVSDLNSSERPATINQMETDLSAQNRTQLDSNLPFASGVSGSTNILLHLYEEMASRDAVGLDKNEFLMNGMLFLVYDGGHSIHEVLYTANQISKKLGIVKFDLEVQNTSVNAEDFVSDYDQLMNNFSGELRKKMEDAQDAAWKGTQDYLKSHSRYFQAEAHAEEVE